MRREEEAVSTNATAERRQAMASILQDGLRVHESGELSMLLHHLYANAGALPNVARRCSHIKVLHLQVNCNRRQRRATHRFSLIRKRSLVRVQAGPLSEIRNLQAKRRVY
jgi:hypothetical protein